MKIQEFYIERRFILLTKAGFVFFTTMWLLGLALPFFQDKDNNPGDYIVVPIMSTSIFGTLAILTWLVSRQLARRNVALDDDGIWYIHLGKEQGLVPWKRISRVKERHVWQCLDLYDDNRKKLIRLEYQLAGFEALRDILYDNFSLEGPEIQGTAFFKGPWYHAFNVLGAIGLIILFLFYGMEQNPILGYGAAILIVTFVIPQYLMATVGVKIRDDSIEILYPLWKRDLRFSEIEDIQLRDRYYKNMRIPEIWIFSRIPRKPIRLPKLGVDSAILYKVLRKATRLDSRQVSEEGEPEN